MKKKMILLCGMLLAITATVASASEGVNLRWNQCFGDGGVLNKSFACDQNTGSQTMVGSFELASNLPQAAGNEAVIDITSDSATLPAWWEFKNAGTCRQTAMTINFSASPFAVSCIDWANGQASGGIGAYNIGALGPNTARVLTSEAVPALSLADLSAGQEYFAFNLTINNSKTVNTGACAGCQTPVCIVLSSIKVVSINPAINRTLSGPTNGTDSNFCAWQGAGAHCPGATPTKNLTWGTVKSLYR